MHIMIGNDKPSIAVFIGAGVAGLVLLVVIIGVIAGLVIACKRSQQARQRGGFRYAPVAPAAV